MNLSQEIRINNSTLIGENHKTFVIAELGINHNGDKNIAREMIVSAKICGADAVKFQTFRTEEFLSDKELDYSYMQNGEYVTERMWDMFKRVELSLDNYRELFDFALRNNIIPFTSIADKSSCECLRSIGNPIIKLASEDLINIYLLEYLKNCEEPIILSTGMANEYEIDNALGIFKNKKNIVLLHCVSLYPTPINKLNLKRMISLKDRYKKIVGFSDHSSSLISGAIAVAIGARVIEKHFTLSNDMKGPDHSISLNPDDFRAYVKNIRDAEILIGEGNINPQQEEKEASFKFRRSLTAACDLTRGEILTENMILLQRPGHGMKPYEISKVVGKPLLNNKKKGDKIFPADFNIVQD